MATFVARTVLLMEGFLTDFQHDNFTQKFAENCSHIIECRLNTMIYKIDSSIKNNVILTDESRSILNDLKNIIVHTLSVNDMKQDTCLIDKSMYIFPSGFVSQKWGIYGEIFKYEKSYLQWIKNNNPHRFEKIRDLMYLVKLITENYLGGVCLIGSILFLEKHGDLKLVKGFYSGYGYGGMHIWLTDKSGFIYDIGGLTNSANITKGLLPVSVSHQYCVKKIKHRCDLDTYEEQMIVKNIEDFFEQNYNKSNSDIVKNYWCMFTPHMNDDQKIVWTSIRRNFLDFRV